jgi:hypothetical protein
MGRLKESLKASEQKIESRFNKVDDKFENLDRKVEENIKSLERRVDDRLGGLDRRLGDMQKTLNLTIKGLLAFAWVVGGGSLLGGMYGMAYWMA